MSPAVKRNPGSSRDVVVVTSDVRPIESFSIQPPRTSFGVGYDTTLAARATDAAGDSVPGIRIDYRSSAPKVASYDVEGVFRPMTMGTTTLRASTMNYGIAHADEVELTVTEPVVFYVDIGYYIHPDGVFDTTFDPAEITIKAGQGVAWGSRNAISATIMFDDPTNVGASPVDGKSGDLGYTFAWFPDRVIRMFHVPGEYVYRDAATGKTAVGKVIVTP